jgi:hypothetical protein
MSSGLCGNKVLQSDTTLKYCNMVRSDVLRKWLKTVAAAMRNARELKTVSDLQQQEGGGLDRCMSCTEIYIDQQRESDDQDNSNRINNLILCASD